MGADLVTGAGPVGRPGRRAVLSAGTLAALVAVTGCTSGGGSPGPTRRSARPDPDPPALARAAAASTALLAAVLTARDLTADVRVALAAGHRAQLVALGVPSPTAGSPTAGSPTAGGDPTPSPTAPTSPGRLLAAHWDAAQQALTDVAVVSRPAAVLLTRIAAARAAHADVVARAADLKPPGVLTVTSPVLATPSPGTSVTGSPTGSPSAPSSPTSKPSGPVPTLTPRPTVTRAAEDVDALSRLVEAEHAALFGYALVVARVSVGRRERAELIWAAHRRTRDSVESLLVAAGATPPAALPAYAVDPPSGSRAATDLAADVEAGVARVAAWSAGRGSGPVRELAAAISVAATRRQAEWLGAVPPFGPPSEG